MAETKQFKAESKRLLEMMINSIYTHKEIFLRELISNASDAIDKLYFKSLTDDKIGMSRSDFKITVKADKDSRTLTITDNGIGMTAEELENNLGIIANSGSLAFKTENADAKGSDIDVIGQFGVGFYSAFMVAKEVEVRTKAYGSDKGYVWKSEGVDGYTIDEYDKDSVGTEIILTIKDKTDDEDYDEYLSQWKIKSLVKKYSDYIRYPIMMDMVKTRYLDNDKDDENGNSEPKTEEYIETETLNSMVPIWKKNKNEVTEEEYNSFYKEKFFDYTDPLKSIHVKTEGTATYSALLYIPSKAPFDYYSKNYEKGLQLYSSGVLIMDKCADLLPDHFSFVRGLVDSEDLSLNISRELLQHDRQLKLIAKSLERTIKNELKKMLTNEREKYEEFWKQFGIQVKFGVYNEYGSHKDILKDLLLFTSSMEKKLVTLDEYVSRMKEDQKYIYYASGDTADKIDLLPQIERFKEKGIEVLYLTDSVDEFALKTLMNYEEKEFKSVSESGSELDSEEEKEAAKKASEENKDLLESLKNALDGKVADVVVSEKLKSHPVCLSNKGEISIEMEKILNSMPNDAGKVKAEKVLEINASHPVFEKLKALHAEDNKDAVSKYAKILYDEALLIEGMPIENPLEFSKLVCELMV